MGLTTELAKDLFAIQTLLDRDRLQLKTLILDFFAAAYAGYRQNRKFNGAVENAIYSQGGAEESCVLFQPSQYPVRTAAFMNAVYGHGAELDDGNKRASGHAGVYLIPAVFALADKLHNSNEDVLVALATGYEAFVRISSAAQPGIVQRGFHSTGMAGVLASAAACARLYHLGSQGIEDAIGLASTMASGLLSYGDSRPAIKPLNPGKAAENGVLAAMLAASGVQGPTEALEGRNGWFHAVTDTVDERCLQGSDHLMLHDCYIKLYPSCRHTHCGIDAAIALHGVVRPEEIKEIRVFIYPNAIRLAGIRMPQNQDDTKFSIHYTLARALLNGAYGIGDMDPPKLTHETLEMMDKIMLIPDASMENRDKGIRGVRVEIEKKSGERLQKTVLQPKGDPECPLSRQDILGKLETCAGHMASAETLKALADAIDRLDGCDTFVNPMRIVNGSLSCDEQGSSRTETYLFQRRK